MPTNKEILEKFYNAFVAGNAQEMTSCYDDTIIFSDPAFGTLNGERAKAMWYMLISRGKGVNKVTYEIDTVSGNCGTVHWTARYPYGPKKRPVVNNVTATIKIENGKINEHHDIFDMRSWSKQALGFSGYLLGGTAFLNKKIQGKTNALLTAYISKNPNAQF